MSTKIKKTKLNARIRFALMVHANALLRDPDDDRTIEELRAKLLNTFIREYAEFSKLPDQGILERYDLLRVCNVLKLDYDDAAEVKILSGNSSEWNTIVRMVSTWGDDDKANIIPLPESVKFITEGTYVMEQTHGGAIVKCGLMLSHRTTKVALPETFAVYKELCAALKTGYERRLQLLKDMVAILKAAANLEEVEEVWPEASAVRAKLDIRDSEAKLPSVISDDLRQRLCENFKKRGVSSTSTICGAINPVTGLAEGGSSEAAE